MQNFRFVCTFSIFLCGSEKFCIVHGAQEIAILEGHHPRGTPLPLRGVLRGLCAGLLGGSAANFYTGVHWILRGW